MVAFPHCKINLGLRINGKRADGYHDLETVFYPVKALTDALEVLPTAGTPTVELTCTGLPVQGPVADNLCVKAWHLLKADYPQLPPVHIHLHKVIPMGAGLGGGSSDAAFMLQLLNNRYQLQLGEEKLSALCAQLGSDCAFFAQQKPCLGKGRGELLHPINLDLSAYQIVLVYPGIHVNTGWAFSSLVRSSMSPTTPSVLDAVNQPIHTWRETLVNDFEATVFAAHPELGQIKASLYEQGALYASMSGSGSTVYGLFRPHQPLAFNFPAHYFMKVAHL
jgi:4-diphosphocytidyl-2-C-methyl-D-erythritol kinase